MIQLVAKNFSSCHMPQHRLKTNATTTNIVIDARRIVRARDVELGLGEPRLERRLPFSKSKCVSFSTGSVGFSVGEEIGACGTGRLPPFWRGIPLHMKTRIGRKRIGAAIGTRTVLFARNFLGVGNALYTGGHHQENHRRSTASACASRSSRSQMSHAD